VSLTPGWVNLQEMISAYKWVLAGIPELHARIDDLAAEGDSFYVRLTVTDINTGRYFGASSTGRSYEVNMFDWARFEDGRIAESLRTWRG
jgi:predicted ester cyclase